MASDEHDAADSPLEQRIGYAKVVAMMAAADDELERRERDHLEELCEALALPPEATKGVLAAAEAASEVDLREALAVLRESDLRFTLFADCLVVAHADDEIVAAEERLLRELAGALDIDADQQAALRKLAEAMSGGEVDDEEIRRGLRSANIPTRPLAYISATGFGVIGSTVGVGVLAAVIGIPTGVGVLVGLGIGSMIGVRWLHRQLDRPEVAADV